MTNKQSALAGWTPEQIAQTRQWVDLWRKTGRELERIARAELRALDTRRAIELLCCEADFRRPPWAPPPTSGLIEMQRLFKKVADRERSVPGSG